MKKIFLLGFILTTFVLFSGCFLDKFFGTDKEETVPPSYTLTTITGAVSVPDAGAGKVMAKIMYKAAPETTRIYLLLSSKTWAQKLDYLNNYEYVTTIDSTGHYQFDRAVKGTSYCIIVDINSDGKCDELVTEIVAGDTIASEVTSFVRELNTSGSLMLGLKLDKDQYDPGNEIKFSVTGYVTESANVHVEVWNETSSGKYIWTSTPAAVAAGEVSKEFTHVIPDGWASSSTGADYKAFAAIDTQLLASDKFVINGTNAGDSTAPNVGTLAINNGAEKTGFLEVTLNITIPDNTATQMIISNASSNYDNATWEAAAVTRPWKLTSGSGIKNVYIKFADSSGNTTEEFTDAIEYTDVTYTVTFNSNGGAAVADQILNYGSLAVSPTDPARTSYRFDGWYKEPALINAWQFGADTVTANITLYAKWVEVNDPPSLLTNTGITLAEGAVGTVITTAHLNEGDPDDSGAEITYTVTTVPTGGSLKKSGAPLAVDGTFTQADIDSSIITYDHNGGEAPTDSFIFTLADGGEDGVSTLTDQTFVFTVTPVNDSPVLVTNQTMTITEFTTGTITSAYIEVTDPDNTPAELTYFVGGAPTKGILRRNGTILAYGDTFTQADINNNLVTYQATSPAWCTDFIIVSIEDPAHAVGAGGKINIIIQNP